MTDDTVTYLPDPANDETLTMTGYEWWAYRRAIEAQAAAQADARVVQWREAFASVGEQWAAVLKHFELAEDATAADVIELAERDWTMYLATPPASEPRNAITPVDALREILNSWARGDIDNDYDRWALALEEGNAAVAAFLDAAEREGGSE